MELSRLLQKFLASPRDDNINSSLFNVNSEINKLVTDVELYADLTFDDYVKRIRNSEAWKKIKANEKIKNKVNFSPQQIINSTYIGDYRTRKHAITFQEIKKLDL